MKKDKESLSFGNITKFGYYKDFFKEIETVGVLICTKMSMVLPLLENTQATIPFHVNINIRTTTT